MGSAVGEGQSAVGEGRQVWEVVIARPPPPLTRMARRAAAWEREAATGEDGETRSVASQRRRDRLASAVCLRDLSEVRALQPLGGRCRGRYEPSPPRRGTVVGPRF